MASEPKPKRILVIDGGGIRGLASLMIIDAIMKEIATKTGQNRRPCEIFDLICGTSVGGLISILLGRLGLDCQRAIDVYKTIVKKLFGEQKDAWNIIAKGQFLDTLEFDKYIAQEVKELAGSPDALMHLAGEGDHVRESTKTFVTVMENAPSYTHIVSSYPRERLSASAQRPWTVTEAIKATTASPIYFSPIRLELETNRMQNFQDAGFGGYNNPISLASSEWQTIWREERVGSVISLGTGLQSYLPNPVPKTRVWGPTPSYVRNLCDQVLQKRLPGTKGYGDVESNLAYAIRQLARIAADSSLSHQSISVSGASFCEHYYRIDEPFGLDQFDLIDVHQEERIKDKFNDWLQTGVIEDIVQSLRAESRPAS
ncbi:acyl transferase/acyl hydrolase/lysophospholipase [Amanita rubescens]|nr:acyl transferase/acyl hydrolase/lysophospholipase [Amanita rubescens]KAF8328466.1 acyl transferase/acyl hydrolase/lysophospholipase [Amanita rubescens]KAF8335126.1 acyl transferase/acyl hydrolase/lysophospholipase [Amanita rubescens]